jgi:hypothetical protein
MKFFLLLSGLASAGNLYLGARFFLNVVGLLQTTKYGPVATAVFAVLFLVLGIGGLYAAVWMGDVRLALLLSIGPWVLAVVGMIISALIGYYG